MLLFYKIDGDLFWGAIFVKILLMKRDEEGIKVMRINREEITDKVYTAIRETLNVQDLELEMQTNILEDLSMDSVDGITLIMDLEEMCEISIEDEEFANFVTIESIVDYIENALKNKELCDA